MTNESDAYPASQYQQIIHDLHTHLVHANRFPRGDQTIILREFFNNGRMVLLAQCGRDAGKTETIILYSSWRFALTHKNSLIWIICPEKLQGKRIYWTSKRLPNYGPQKYVQDKIPSDLRLEFINGSTISVDGCENYEALRGGKPDFVLEDERQHHSRYFDEEVMQPNLSRGRTALIAVGTPPKRHCDYVEFRKEVMEKISRGNKKYFYIELPTWTNPLSDRAWLIEKRSDLYRKGKKNVWLREYEGKLVFDTESAILPFWNADRHMVPRASIEEMIKRDKKRLLWYAIFDPGTATCFAVLFVCVNPYTSEVFILDEIYETRRGENTAMKIWWRVEEKKRNWYDRLESWVNIYDSAATWFINEVLTELSKQAELEGGEKRVDTGFIPTNKVSHIAKPEEGRAGESTLNALMESDHPQLFRVNDECTNFQAEVESYVTTTEGKYPSNFDHLIDCFFYWLQNSFYSISGQTDPDIAQKLKDKEVRGESFDMAVEKELQRRDWTRGLEDDIFDFGDEDGWN